MDIIQIRLCLIISRVKKITVIRYICLQAFISNHLKTMAGSSQQSDVTSLNSTARTRNQYTTIYGRNGVASDGDEFVDSKKPIAKRVVTNFYTTKNGSQFCKEWFELVKEDRQLREECNRLRISVPESCIILYHGSGVWIKEENFGQSLFQDLALVELMNGAMKSDIRRHKNAELEKKSDEEWFKIMSD